MTIRQRVADTGRTLTLIALGRSILSGAAAGLAFAAVAWPIASALAFSHLVAPAVAAVAAGVVTLWFYRRVRGPGFTIPAVSLWLEERIPSLKYALVTAVEPGAPPSLEKSLAGVDWSPATRDAAKNALAGPSLAALTSAAFLALSIGFAPAVVRLAERSRPERSSSNRALDVTVQVVPPAYARRRGESFRNPSLIRALVGSELRVTVRGVDSVQLDAGQSPISADRPWRVAAQPVALRVRSGGASRLIAIDPVTDSAPAIQLRAPARDTVLAAPRGSFVLGADVRDDLGIGRAAFEYIVSSGSGESFTFATGSIGARRFDGAAIGAISGALSLGALNLKPGDFVHVRAVAFDLRNDTASARGTSETRTIRVARAGEYDSVAVEAASPADADKAVLSQRMLINLAEALVRRRSRLNRATFSDESRSIARDQARLRKQVGDLVFARLGDDPSGEHFHGDGHQHEGQELRPALTPDELLKAAENATAATAGRALDFESDETPVVAVNRPLLEAYNFMWDAGRELEQASTERALPHMYRALEAIQRARAAERLYLRSRPPRAVVDVDRVRLQGREKGTPAAREPLTSLGSSPGTGVARAALARFARVVRLARSDPAAASDSLLLLRIDLLPTLTPEAAAAAADAAVALRNGRDAAQRLAVFRRSLGPATTASDSMPRWSGAR